MIHSLSGIISWIKGDYSSLSGILKLIHYPFRKLGNNATVILTLPGLQYLSRQFNKHNWTLVMAFGKSHHKFGPWRKTKIKGSTTDVDLLSVILSFGWVYLALTWIKFKLSGTRQFSGTKILKTWQCVSTWIKCCPALIVLYSFFVINSQIYFYYISAACTCALMSSFKRFI